MFVLICYDTLDGLSIIGRYHDIKAAHDNMIRDICFTYDVDEKLLRGFNGLFVGVGNDFKAYIKHMQSDCRDKYTECHYKIFEI